jgi:hypothetical protein
VFRQKRSDVPVEFYMPGKATHVLQNRRPVHRDTVDLGLGSYENANNPNDVPQLQHTMQMLP